MHAQSASRYNTTPLQAAVRYGFRQTERGQHFAANGNDVQCLVDNADNEFETKFSSASDCTLDVDGGDDTK